MSRQYKAGDPPPYGFDHAAYLAFMDWRAAQKEGGLVETAFAQLARRGGWL